MERATICASTMTTIKPIMGTPMRKRPPYSGQAMLRHKGRSGKVKAVAHRLLDDPGQQKWEGEE